MITLNKTKGWTPNNAGTPKFGIYISPVTGTVPIFSGASREFSMFLFFKPAIGDVNNNDAAEVECKVWCGTLGRRYLEEGGPQVGPVRHQFCGQIKATSKDLTPNWWFSKETLLCLISGKSRLVEILYNLARVITWQIFPHGSVSMS